MDLPHQLQLRAWISRALAEAHQHRVALGRGLPALSVKQRLRRYARRLAPSASAYEQLLGVALAAAADHEDRAYRSLELRRLSQAPEPLAQLELRTRALAAIREDGDALIDHAVRREARRSRRIGGRPEHAASWLMEVAGLNRMLWDHPGLQLEAPQRAVLLACAARLEARAFEISRSGAERLRLGPSALTQTC
jgi:hypothetical protein